MQPAARYRPTWCRPRRSAAPGRDERRERGARTPPDRRPAAAGAGRRHALNASTSRDWIVPSKPCPPRIRERSRARCRGTPSTATTVRAPGPTRAHHHRRRSDGHSRLRSNCASATHHYLLPSARRLKSVRLNAMLERFAGQRAWAPRLLAQARGAGGGDGRGPPPVWLTAWVDNALAFYRAASFTTHGGHDAVPLGQGPTRTGGSPRPDLQIAAYAPRIRLIAGPPRHQPDASLDTPQGSATPRPSANAIAWRRCRTPPAWRWRASAQRLMVGAQVRARAAGRAVTCAERSAIVFDAILVQRFRRCAPLFPQPRRSRRCGDRRLVPHAAQRPAWRETRPGPLTGRRRAGSAATSSGAAAPAGDAGLPSAGIVVEDDG